MNQRSLTFVCLAAVFTFHFADSAACPLQNLEIARAVAAKVSVFTGNGRFERAVKQDEVLSGKVVACKEALGLVQIVRADGSRLWIDPIEVRLRSVPVK